jgi:hypothetical protein
MRLPDDKKVLTEAEAADFFAFRSGPSITGARQPGRNSKTAWLPKGCRISTSVSTREGDSFSALCDGFATK